nr:FtsX-like permease family protein [Lachnospiraceae bacterium]
MKYITLLRVNIKRQKGSFIGIFALIFIITVSLCAVLTVRNNSNEYEAQQMERLGFGDITSWKMGDIKDIEALKSKIENIAETKEVRLQKIAFVNYFVNGNEAGSNGQVTAYEPAEYDYYIYQRNLAGIEENPSLLSSGEMYVPIAFTALYHAKIGDEVKIKISDENDMQTFTIKGFFEDPFMGSTMMGMKMMLMNQEDMNQLILALECAGENKRSGGGAALHIFKDENELSVSEFQSLLNEKANFNGDDNTFTYQKSTIMGFMLILQNIFAAFLLVFVLVLLMVALLVTSHSIVSSIEQDYADMGILKAVGFTKRDLQLVKTLQYWIAIILGMLIGVPVSVPVARIVTRYTVTVTGLMIPAAIPIGPCLIGLFSILLLLTAIICIKTAMIDKITPIRAIRGGGEDIYFQSRFVTPIHKTALNLHLALRQLVSGKKQYISACFVTVVLVFFLSLIGKLEAWIGPDGKGLIDSFNAVPYDIGVGIRDEGITQEEITKLIEDFTEIKDVYWYNATHGVANNMEYLMNICEKPEYYNILEGRTCIYDNEVLVTEVVAEKLGVSIGDTLEIQYNNKTLDFIITGINQCANDMGDNFSITKDGFLRFGVSNDVSDFTHYILVQSNEKEAIVNKLEEMYGERVSLDDNSWSGTESIVTVMDVIVGFMYIITVIFIFVVIIMSGSKILYREQKDLGIYKALGFSAAKLRITFALRFALVAVLGSVFGVTAGIFLANP